MAINYTYPVKSSPVTADEFLIIDSVDNSTKKVTASSVLSLVDGGVTSIQFSAPLTGGTITTTGSVGITQAGAASNGYLSSTDWNTFNSKLSSTGGITVSGNVTLLGWQESVYEFRGDIDGAVRFTAQAGETLVKGDIVYVSDNQSSTVIVSKAKADSSTTMPAFGIVYLGAASGNELQIVTLGSLYGSGSNPLNTSTDSDGNSLSFGDTLYVSAINAGGYTKIAPSGETSLIQNIGKVVRRNNNNGIIKVGGAGRTNATPNLNSAKIFLGNSSNQSVATAVTGEVTISNTGVTEVTGIDGNVSIQGYSPVVISAETAVELTTENLGKTLVLSAGTTEFSITDSASFAVGTEINLINSAGQIIVAAPTGGGNLNGDTEDVLITAAYGQAILKKIASDTYVIYGDIV